MASKKPLSLRFNSIFRTFLRNAALSMIASKYKGLSMTEAKKELLKKIEISPSALEAMLYRGSGGMDTWVTLFVALSDTDAESFDLALTELQDILKRKHKLTKGDAAWIKRGESLSDDKKLFWSDLISFMEEVDDGPYAIQRKKQ